MVCSGSHGCDLSQLVSTLELVILVNLHVLKKRLVHEVSWLLLKVTKEDTFRNGLYLRKNIFFEVAVSVHVKDSSSSPNQSCLDSPD